MTGAPRPSLPDRRRTEIAHTTASGARRVLTAVLLVIGSLALAAGTAVSLYEASTPTAGDVAFVSGTTGELSVDYVDAPSVAYVDYRHGADASYAIELRNDGPLAVTVEDVPLDPAIDERRLIRPIRVLLAPEGATPDEPVDARPFEPFRLERDATRTVIVQGVFDNCAYYTERAMDVRTSQPVTWSIAGWSTTSDVQLGRQLAVRSPYLRVCPGRVMDRGAATRTAPVSP